jgi:AraC-like DNA-binding protein
METKNELHYLSLSKRDEEWGIVVTTVGNQTIAPHASYPPSQHPQGYEFQPVLGRVLNEYQLVYIIEGSGYFSSQSCALQPISAGTMILLFPGEWHSYYPDQQSGWKEYWVGFKGAYIDQRVERGFFHKREPLHQLNKSLAISTLYEEIIQLATTERMGYQQIISSIVLHLLGTVYYEALNHAIENNNAISKIDEARLLMKERVENPPSSQEVAHQIGVGYSWFRKAFKQILGISPAQYQMQQQIQYAKELLTKTDKSINDIAYQLNFESGGQFSTFFKKKEGITPSRFRESSATNVRANE